MHRSSRFLGPKLKCPFRSSKLKLFIFFIVWFFNDFIIQSSFITNFSSFYLESSGLKASSTRVQGVNGPGPPQSHFDRHEGGDDVHEQQRGRQQSDEKIAQRQLPQEDTGGRRGYYCSSGCRRLPGSAHDSFCEAGRGSDDARHH